jgi:hypothetical protein
MRAKGFTILTFKKCVPLQLLALSRLCMTLLAR